MSGSTGGRWHAGSPRCPRPGGGHTSVLRLGLETSCCAQPSDTGIPFPPPQLGRDCLAGTQCTTGLETSRTIEEYRRPRPPVIPFLQDQDLNVQQLKEFRPWYRAFSVTNRQQPRAGVRAQGRVESAGCPSSAREPQAGLGDVVCICLPSRVQAPFLFRAHILHVLSALF